MGAPAATLAVATVLEAIQFTVSILTRFVLRTWSSLPPREILEPRRSLEPLLNRPNRRRHTGKRERKRERNSRVSISSRWLVWVRFFFRLRTNRFSSRREERRPAAMQNARMRRLVKYLDPTWRIYYSARTAPGHSRTPRRFAITSVYIAAALCARTLGSVSLRNRDFRCYRPSCVLSIFF